MRNAWTLLAVAVIAITCGSGCRPRSSGPPPARAEPAGRTAERPSPPFGIDVYVEESGAAFVPEEPLTGYHVFLVGPTGQVLSRCIGARPWQREGRCQFRSDWFRGPGTYRCEVRLQRGFQRVKKASLSFPADGRELSFEGGLWFELRSSRLEQSTPDSLQISRILPGEPGITLTGAGPFPLASVPAFRLENRSRQPIYGTEIGGNFFGWVEEASDEGWKRSERGGRCGTVEEGRPLTPGQQTFSFEGAFISDPEPFQMGTRYRFVLRYSNESLWKGAAEVGETDGIDTKLFEVHQLATPFQVGPPRMRPSGRRDPGS